MKKMLIWLENGNMYGAVFDKDTVKIYDENCVLLLKRENVSSENLKLIYKNINAVMEDEVSDFLSWMKRWREGM